jgi:hypothetical protein
MQRDKVIAVPRALSPENVLIANAEPNTHE